MNEMTPEQKAARLKLLKESHARVQQRRKLDDFFTRLDSGSRYAEPSVAVDVQVEEVAA